MNDLLDKIQESENAHKIIEAARILGNSTYELSPQEFKLTCELAYSHILDIKRQCEINQLLLELED